MSTKDICENPNLSDEEKWRLLYGTDYTGNLPQYKTTQHSGHSWMPCPYDTRVSDEKTRYMLNLSDTDPLPVKVLHTSNGRDYFMKTASQVSWGFSCTFENCPHKINNGTPYFYK